ncbi:MAG: M48 family metallopeptidase [Acidobacteriota bacterium]|nr:M48 family metallopeptidase [Acidobacteriota bacterium]
MQLRLPWDVLAPRRRAPREHAITIAGAPIAVDIVRHHRARRYVLRVGTDGRIRLTVPRRGSIAAGLRFAERQAAWIARQRQRQAERDRPWTDGTTVLMRGESMTLRVAGGMIHLGGQHVMLDSGDVRRTLEQYWRALAEAELPGRCRELAGQFDVQSQVARISVRNQRSRWGACSTRGVITLNWRLVQMPPAVSDYVILHELTHLHHPNHSIRFWRAVERVCPDWREAERWLRKNGRHLL